MNISPKNSATLSFLNSEHIKRALSPLLRMLLPELEHLQCTSPNDLKRIIEEKDLRYVFVQSRNENDSVLKFIQTVKAKKGSNKTRFILICKKDDVSSEKLSEYVSVGVTAVLVEPLSQKSVQEALKVSEQLGLKGSIERLKVATRLQVGALLASEQAVKEKSNVLKAINFACQLFETKTQQGSIQLLAQELGDMTPDQRLQDLRSGFYQGASKRVRNLLFKK